MPIDLSGLDNTSRLRLSIPLKVAQGHRFQPTGFPDLGAATYQAAGGECLLVESAQSMANRLEKTIWDEAQQDLTEGFGGLSYVRVVDQDDQPLTSSITEAHRLNSAYIEKANDGKFHKELAEKIQASKKGPVDRSRFVQSIFKYDVNSLLHGVFLESIDGRLRIARVLSGFIEAEGVGVAPSGGVKNDRVMPGKEAESQRTAAEGFGNVPFQRTEYTAEHITAYFNLDLAQIRGYGLGNEAERLLILLALYKIRALLADDLRLRTACEFEVDTDKLIADKPEGFELPSLKELAEELPSAISACTDQFAGEGGITTVQYKM